MSRKYRFPDQKAKDKLKAWNILDRELYVSLTLYIEEQALIQGLTTGQMVSRVDRVLQSGFKMYVWVPIKRTGFVKKSLSIAYILNIIQVVSNDTDDFFRYYLNYRKQQRAYRQANDIPEYVCDKHLPYVPYKVKKRRKKAGSKSGVPKATRAKPVPEILQRAES